MQTRRQDLDLLCSLNSVAANSVVGHDVFALAPEKSVHLAAPCQSPYQLLMPTAPAYKRRVRLSCRQLGRLHASLPAKTLLSMRMAAPPQMASLGRSLHANLQLRLRRRAATAQTLPRRWILGRRRSRQVICASHIPALVRGIGRLLGTNCQTHLRVQGLSFRCPMVGASTRYLTSDAGETLQARTTGRAADGRPQPGASPVVRDMSVSLQPGTRTLLIGANGAGKTTLLKVSLVCHERAWSVTSSLALCRVQRETVVIPLKACVRAQLLILTMNLYRHEAESSHGLTQHVVITFAAPEQPCWLP